MQLPPIYKTIKGSAEVENIVQKSRFIGYALPVHNEEEVAAFLSQVRQIHRHATHHCYAYQLSEHVQKYDDAKEPSGTAGRPILKAIEDNQLLLTLVVVTRYFGGIKLGTGGLARAYRQSAMDTLTSAGMVQKTQYQEIQLIFTHAQKRQVEQFLHHIGLPTSPTLYHTHVEKSVWAPINEVPSFIQQIQQNIPGELIATPGEVKYMQQECSGDT